MLWQSLGSRNPEFGSRAWLVLCLCLLAAPAWAQPVTHEGTLIAEVEDHPDKAVVRHYIERADHSRVQLRASPQLEKLVGRRVRVTVSQPPGLAVGELAVEKLEVMPLVPQLPHSRGAQRILVMPITFTNQAYPWTGGELNRAMDWVDRFWREGSFGTAWVSATVTPPVSIALAASNCNYWQIGPLAKAAAQDAGYAIANYDRYVYAFGGMGCPWYGLAEVGTFPTQAWIHNNVSAGVMAHELGHNLGLWHAHSLGCWNGAPICIERSEGYFREYGDTFDTMGNSNAGHYNAYEKARLAWLNAPGVPALREVTGPGTYTVDAYATPPGTNPKALMFKYGPGSVPNEEVWLYFEYRTAYGFDAFIGDPLYVQIPMGFLVHRGDEPQGVGNNTLYDMTPGTFPGSYRDFDDASLAVGRSWTHAASGLVFTTQGVTGTQATLMVSGGPSAAPSAPSNLTAVSQ